MYIDAPVNGTPMRASQGTAPVMVGANDEAFDAVRPVLSALSSHIHRVGGPGCGTAANLTIQMLAGAHKLAACEVGIRHHVSYWVVKLFWW